MGQPPLKYLQTRKAAVDCMYAIPFSINTNEVNAAVENPYFLRRAWPASLCNGANRIVPFLSLFSTKLTMLLQKLQTPSNNITGP